VGLGLSSGDPARLPPSPPTRCSLLYGAAAIQRRFVRGLDPNPLAMTPNLVPTDMLPAAPAGSPGDVERRRDRRAALGASSSAPIGLTWATASTSRTLRHRDLLRAAPAPTRASRPPPAIRRLEGDQGGVRFPSGPPGPAVGLHRRPRGDLSSMPRALSSRACGRAVHRGPEVVGLMFLGVVRSAQLIGRSPPAGSGTWRRPAVRSSADP